MSTTVTSLMPDLYQALDVVSRELVGFIPAVTLDSGASRAAVGQNVRSFVTGAANVSDTTPSMTLSEPTAQTVANIAVIITKSRAAEFGWTGAEQSQVNSGGAGYARIRQDQMIQAMRKLTNEIEADIAATHISASRAFGTSGTTPFATDLSDTANVRKIISDNGQFASDMQGVIDTTAGAKMRTLAQLTKASEANDATFLRQGTLLDVHNFAFRESAQVVTSVSGTGAAYTSSAAGFAIGATTIAIITGAGTVLAGDVITFAGDTNKYVVSVGVGAPGNIVLAAPGLRKAIPAAATAMTITAASARSMFFPRSAIVLSTRMPEMPEEGDAAEDGGTITDPRSGLTFEVLIYKGRRKVRYELGIAWGVKVIKTEGISLLLG